MFRFYCIALFVLSTAVEATLAAAEHEKPITSSLRKLTSQFLNNIDPLPTMWNTVMDRNWRLTGFHQFPSKTMPSGRYVTQVEGDDNWPSGQPSEIPSSGSAFPPPTSIPTLKLSSIPTNL